VSIASIVFLMDHALETVLYRIASHAQIMELVLFVMLIFQVPIISVLIVMFPSAYNVQETLHAHNVLLAILFTLTLMVHSVSFVQTLIVIAVYLTIYVLAAILDSHLSLVLHRLMLLVSYAMLQDALNAVPTTSALIVPMEPSILSQANVIFLAL
jgi:hypothetical protein